MRGSALLERLKALPDRSVELLYNCRTEARIVLPGRDEMRGPLFGQTGTAAEAIQLISMGCDVEVLSGLEEPPPAPPPPEPEPPPAEEPPPEPDPVGETPAEESPSDPPEAPEVPPLELETPEPTPRRTGRRRARKPAAETED